MIVECNGLPGCGKTTLVENMSKKLSELNIAHNTVSVNSFRNGSKFKRSLTILNPCILRAALESNKMDESLAFLSLKERLITQMYLHYLLKEYNSTKNLILCDEGIVQTLATVNSFTDKETCDIRKAKKILNTKSLLVFNCELSIDDSIERITNRRRHNSAIDNIQGSVLKDYLTRQEKELRVIRNSCRNCIAFDMKKSVNELVVHAITVLEDSQ